MFHEPLHITINRRAMKFYKIDDEDGDEPEVKTTTACKKQKIKYKILKEEDDFLPEGKK